LKAIDLSQLSALEVGRADWVEVVALRLVDRAVVRVEARRPTLAELYRDHFDFVFRIALRLDSRLDPEDVAQEVFLVVARKLDSFAYETAHPTTWLYGITHNIVRGMRRRLFYQLRRHVSEAEAERVPVRSTDAAELRDAYDQASEILSKMSTRKRDVFVLAEFEGLSCAEIAAVVGTKEQTVWSRLFYARQEFSRRLASRQQRERGAARD
jgi:RNA polymerase sigma-70 factor (ECF subfamily)